MFDHILVPLVGSGLSEQALPMAQKLARSSKATIHLIQVISRQAELEASHSSGDYSLQLSEMGRDLARRLIEDRLSRGKEYLERVAATVKDGGVEVQTAIREGAADENIVIYTKEHGVDLVVMSTHGYGGVKRLLLGSVTDRVIRSCEVPVLVMPCS